MNVKDITKNMVSERKTKEDSNFVRIIKGSILSIILTIICLLIFSLILAYTNIPEKTMIPVITAVTAITALIITITTAVAATAAARNLRKATRRNVFAPRPKLFPSSRHSRKPVCSPRSTTRRQGRRSAGLRR